MELKKLKDVCGSWELKELRKLRELKDVCCFGGVKGVRGS